MAVILTSACSKDRIRLKGEGPVVTEERTVGQFDQVKVSIAAEVVWHQSADVKLIVEAQKNIAEFLITEQNGDRININFKPLTTIRNHKPITIHLFSPNAESIELSGSGSVLVHNDVNSDNLEVKVSGSGNVKLKNHITDKLEVRISGSGHLELTNPALCQSAEYRISGSGKVNGLSMPTNNVEINISGSGQAELNVNDNLEAQISGSGKVKYTGTPRVETTITGSGKVERI